MLVNVYDKEGLRNLFSEFYYFDTYNKLNNEFYEDNLCIINLKGVSRKEVKENKLLIRDNIIGIVNDINVKIIKDIYELVIFYLDYYKVKYSKREIRRIVTTYEDFKLYPRIRLKRLGIESSEETIKMYELFNDYFNNRNEFFKKIFNYLENNCPEYIFSSFLTFLKNLEKDSMMFTEYYKELLMKLKSSNINYLKFVNKFIDNYTINFYYSLLNLFMNI